MRMKTIYAVFLLIAIGAGRDVFAQKSEEQQKFYTMDRIVSKSGWLMGENPAGLVFNQANLSTADVNYNFEKGGLHNVGDGAKVHKVGIQTESFQRAGKLSFYGKLGYNYAASAERSWAGNSYLYTSPMAMGDSIPGNVRNETYELKAGVAYEFGHFAIGAMAEYENQSMAKRRDSRNQTTYMNMSIKPGILFRSKVVNAGLNLNYERTTEEVEYKAFGTNTTAGTVYLFEGLWFYKAEQLISNGIEPVLYKGTTYGGSAQLELNISPTVKFFNQFSADYSKMERYRQRQDQRLGDNDQLVYRYMGQLNFTGKRIEQSLKVDASFGDLMQYNNIQEIVLDPETNQKMYVQYGRFLKFSQRQRSVDADYKMYVKRNEWNSSWIINLGYSYRSQESHYTINPVAYNQDLHYSDFRAGLTKNFLFNKTNWLDVTIAGGYIVGGGTQLDIDSPEDLVLENPNYRADLLAYEYNFLTNDRIHAEGGVRYTHHFPAKKIGIYVDIKGRYDQGRSGMFNKNRRAMLLAAVGLNF